jgi:hypothetical protein
MYYCHPETTLRLFLLSLGLFLAYRFFPCFHHMVSSRNVPGIRASSGGLFPNIGRTILRSGENLVIHRRLLYIQSFRPLLDHRPPHSIDQICDDLLELSRCVMTQIIDFRLDAERSMQAWCLLSTSSEGSVGYHM